MVKRKRTSEYWAHNNSTNPFNASRHFGPFNKVGLAFDEQDRIPRRHDVRYGYFDKYLSKGFFDKSYFVYNDADKHMLEDLAVRWKQDGKGTWPEFLRSRIGYAAFATKKRIASHNIDDLDKFKPKHHKIGHSNPVFKTQMTNLSKEMSQSGSGGSSSELKTTKRSKNSDGSHNSTSVSSMGESSRAKKRAITHTTINNSGEINDIQVNTKPPVYFGKAKRVKMMTPRPSAVRDNATTVKEQFRFRMVSETGQRNVAFMNFRHTAASAMWSGDTAATNPNLMKTLLPTSYTGGTLQIKEIPQASKTNFNQILYDNYPQMNLVNLENMSFNSAPYRTGWGQGLDVAQSGMSASVLFDTHGSGSTIPKVVCPQDGFECASTPQFMNYVDHHKTTTGAATGVWSDQPNVKCFTQMDKGSVDWNFYNASDGPIRLNIIKYKWSNTGEGRAEWKRDVQTTIGGGPNICAALLNRSEAQINGTCPDAQIPLHGRERDPHDILFNPRTKLLQQNTKYTNRAQTTSEFLALPVTTPPTAPPGAVYSDYGFSEVERVQLIIPAGARQKAASQLDALSYDPNLDKLRARFNTGFTASAGEPAPAKFHPETPADTANGTYGTTPNNLTGVMSQHMITFAISVEGLNAPAVSASTYGSPQKIVDVQEVAAAVFVEGTYRERVLPGVFVARRDNKATRSGALVDVQSAVPAKIIGMEQISGVAGASPGTTPYSHH